MKQQALYGSIHCSDQFCGLDDGYPAAAGPLITPSENFLTHLFNGCPLSVIGVKHFDKMKSIEEIKLKKSVL